MSTRNTFRSVKNTIYAAVALLALGCFACFDKAQATSDDQSAHDAALQWLALIDSGHYRQAYEEQPSRIKGGSMGRDYFIKWMETRRVPLGRAHKRSFYNVKHYSTAKGWPDGNYEQIYFKTSFEHKAMAWERVILTRETGRWQVGSYGFQ
jgi:hypothetical protein